ncbi:MAG: NADH-quinone oxidoreductase subunit L [Phycisphaerales bacterium]|jgi:NADH-quinone oxidoreductase subunit L|nr:NADH-quinone oxidoreductase subunit L [Phycisphaerales bacterium]
MAIELQQLVQVVAGAMALGADAGAPIAGGHVSPGPAWAMLIPALPLLGVLIAMFAAIFRVKSKLPAYAAVACLGAAFVVTVALWRQLGGGTQVIHGWDWIRFSWGPGEGQTFIANFGLYVDSLTCLWMLFVTGLATLIALYASEYMSHDQGTGYCRFFAAFCLFVLSMTCLVMADNMILLYLGWEGVGLCSYLLIGYFYKKPSAVAAAKKAFIMNRIGDLGLALGVMLTFVHFGTIEYVQLFASERLQEYLALVGEGRLSEIPLQAQLIPVLLMIGAFGKSAQLPLYVWLPDAMEGPTPVSALIHAATMVTAGVFLIARTFPVFVLSEWALPVVAWVGALTALLAATIGMAQFDIKRIMAYSTVSQLGYMFAGLGVLTTTGAAFHVFTHAFFKATLFLCCGAVMHGMAGQLDLRKLSGLMKVPGWRIVSLAMLVGCLNLAGFPFTAGFFSKDMIIAESFVTPGYGAIGWILLITAGLTAYYTFRVFFRVFVGPVHYEAGDEAHGHDDAHAHDAHGHDAHHAAHGDAHGHDHGAHSHDAHGAHDDHHAGEFHPHAPGWAINTVLTVLAVASILAAGVYFVNKPDHGWVGSMVHDSTAHYVSPFAHHEAAADGAGHDAAHGHAADGHGEHATGHGDEHAAAHAGTFLGMNPHEVMYYVSGVVGFLGIGAAFGLHYLGRTTAARSKADDLLPLLGPIPRWAQNKWYVDELYDFLVRIPLWVASHILHVIDKLLVDGLVNLFGWLPRAFGSIVRPSQSGVLHQYALGMAGGLAVLMVIVLVVLR